MVVACVVRTLSTQPPTPSLPPPSHPQKNDKKISSRFHVSDSNIWRPQAKSPFSTVPFRTQIAQIPNSPPTQAKFKLPLISSLSPPLSRTTTKTTVVLHHRTGATSSTPSSTAPGGPPTTSAAATDVPHRHQVPPHHVRFTDAIS